jgi:hypothetical protein
MFVLQMKVKEVVDYAVAHHWSIPEFQRGFVWGPPKVRDLASSLWMEYPVGSFLPLEKSCTPGAADSSRCPAARFLGCGRPATNNSSKNNASFDTMFFVRSVVAK